MSGERSREKLTEFLDWLGAKGLMAAGTVSARKAAVSKVLGILSEDEAADVLALDLDTLMTRFSNLQGKNYTPDSLVTYKSRVRSSLDEFSEYVRNPLGYRPNIQTRERRVDQPKSEQVKGGTASAAPNPQAEALGTGNIFPIQLRPNLIVRIQGIPFDLTEPEARRIANVILAMANPS
jgi:hypothetical protein